MARLCYVFSTHRPTCTHAGVIEKQEACQLISLFVAEKSFSPGMPNGASNGKRVEQMGLEKTGEQQQQPRGPRRRASMTTAYDGRENRERGSHTGRHAAPGDTPTVDERGGKIPSMTSIGSKQVSSIGVLPRQAPLSRRRPERNGRHAKFTLLNNRS